MTRDPFNKARRQMSRTWRAAPGRRERDPSEALRDAADYLAWLSEARRVMASMLDASHGRRHRFIREALALVAEAERRRRRDDDQDPAGSRDPSPRRPGPGPRRPGGGIQPALVRPDRPNILSGGAEAPLES